MIYTASSIALAVLEVVVHLSRAPLPLNRYLIRMEVPDDVWLARAEVTHLTAPAGWDAEPAGMTSREFGNHWVRRGDTALQAVPSVVVPQESNILLNPAHPDIGRLRVVNTGKFAFDGRIRA